MLDRRVIQLNAGTCSPTPRVVFERVQGLREWQAMSPTQFQWRDGWRLLAESRAALAGYVNASPADLALVENVTVALNIGAAALDLPAGSEILTSDHEYGSIVTLFQRLAAARGWTIRMVVLPRPVTSAGEIVAAFEAAGGAMTRGVFFSHISSPSGLVLPATRLCALARERGWVSVVDGAHGPGQVKVDLAEIGADFYAANCHKWMMAPASVGFLHATARMKHLCRSAISSWGYGYEAGKGEDEAFEGTTRWQYDLEFHGTADRTPQMVLGEALAFRRTLGGDEAVMARTDELRAYLRRKMAGIGILPVFPDGQGLVAMLSAFVLPEAFQVSTELGSNTPVDHPGSRLQKHLWGEHGIECPVTFCAGGVHLRVSTAWFNSFGEIDALVAALPGAIRLCA